MYGVFKLNVILTFFLSSQVCKFNLDTLGPECNWQNDFGYDEGKPCVLLKVNKVRLLAVRWRVGVAACVLSLTRSPMPPISYLYIRSRTLLMI